MAICLCLALLAPVFVAPNVAEASCTYEPLSAPTVSPAVPPATNDLGVVKVTLPDTALFAYSLLTVSMPSDFAFPNNNVGGFDVVPVAAAAGTGVTIVAPGNGAAGNDKGLAPTDFKDNFPADGVGAGGYFMITPNNTFDIQLQSPIGTVGTNNYFYIYFNGINMNNTTGDIKVSFVAPSGSGFSTSLDVTIAKSSTSGSTVTNCKKVTNVNDNGGIIDIISIMEQADDSITKTGAITLEILTKGYKWAPLTAPEIALSPSLTAGGAAAGDYGLASFGWDWAGTAADSVNIAAGAGAASLTSNDTALTYRLPAITATNGISPGRVSFAGLKLQVVDGVAAVGDEVEVEVSGADMTTATVVVAKLVGYEATVSEGTTKNLVAGKINKKIGEFYVEEGAPGSLVATRTITFTLPTGVSWNNLGAYEVVKGGITLNAPAAITGSNNEILKWTVGVASANDGAKVKFKDFRVNVSPDYEGPIEIEVTGSAGVTGKVKVAEVSKMATLEVKDVANVELGKPNQKIGDVTIVEGAADSILDAAGANDLITLTLDAGYRFAKVPTVKVIEGDIDIDEQSVDINGGVLTFDIDSASKKTASKIQISDIYIDALRTAPEGPIKLTFDKVGATNAMNETVFNKSAGDAVIANCITPSMKEGTEGAAMGQFKIGSNIYEIDGVAKVMDVAPYIKSNRTYVPVRYLAYALGVAEADVVWDEASQKATLTKGDNVVELTVGSTTITVNGEAQTMDVAPEVVNNRTMLPARYVAEGLGYVVGWDPGTRTVLISK